jgi:hypothetical protein
VIFLIEYDRGSARRVGLQVFDDGERDAADALRASRELDILRSGLDHEVVVLEASSEAALRKTHSRYFDSIDQMVERLRESSNAFVVRERPDD